MFRIIILALLSIGLVGSAEAGNKKQTRQVAAIQKTFPVVKDLENWDKEQPVLIAQNPDPFKTAQQSSQTTTVIPPITVNVPPAVQPQPDNFIQYLWMLIAGVVGSMFGIPQLMNAFSGSGSKADTVKSVVTQLIQSGVLQAPVQSGLNLIPGVGPILAGLEPQAKQLLLRILQADPVVNPGGVVAAPIIPNAPDMSSLFDKIKILEDQIKAFKQQ